MAATNTISSTSWIGRILTVRVRLIPVVIFSAGLLLTIKIVSFWDSFQAEFKISPTFAAKEEKPAPPISSKEKASEKLITGEKVGTEAVERWHDFNPLDLDATEVRLLQDLAKRRDKIVLKEKQLSSKESILSAVEARLDLKLNELRDLEKKIDEAIEGDEKKHKTKLNKLVKIYEGMKAKDAAKIMQDLHPELIVSIIEQMKQSKSAVILSKMDAEIARIVTTKIAERRHLAEKIAEKEAQINKQDSPKASEKL